MSTSILAGNRATITATLANADGSTVNPSTVKVCVTDSAGTSTALSPSIAYAVGDLSATVTAMWTVADDETSQRWTVTVDSSGACVAAEEASVAVRARREPVAP